MSEFRNSPFGFWITFDNNWTVSVQWGPGNYCHARNTPSYATSMSAYDGKHHEIESKTCEFMIMNRSLTEYSDRGMTLAMDTDRVKGWVTPNEVAQVMYDVSQIPDNLTTYAQVAEFLAKSDWYVPEVDLEAIA
tara:strand:+ start:701 stop:1102 length:402 start_codon:yes stop_codon:yes gene_type:complete